MLSRLEWFLKQRVISFWAELYLLWEPEYVVKIINCKWTGGGGPLEQICFHSLAIISNSPSPFLPVLPARTIYCQQTSSILYNLRTLENHQSYPNGSQITFCSSAFPANHLTLWEPWKTLIIGSALNKRHQSTDREFLKLSNFRSEIWKTKSKKRQKDLAVVPKLFFFSPLLLLFVYSFPRGFACPEKWQHFPPQVI